MAVVVAIIFALIGIVAGTWGAFEVGTPAMLLMWVPCLALIVLGLLSEHQRRGELSFPTRARRRALAVEKGSASG